MSVLYGAIAQHLNDSIAQYSLPYCTPQHLTKCLSALNNSRDPIQVFGYLRIVWLFKNCLVP